MEQRRDFIKKITAAGLYASAFPYISYGAYNSRLDDSPLRIALIGRGGMGANCARTALRVPGVKLVGVCDLYQARLQLAKEEWGADVFTTREYKDILSRGDVDAVIVGTTDHWHQQISIDAMKAGKHVYCEKPVIHKISEAKDLIKAQEESGCVFQTGSQGMSSIGNRKAKQLVQSGAIGSVNLAEAAFTSAPRRPCRIPEDLSPNDIWWERYVMNSPQVAFEPSRFLCWRLWLDYGTGIAGDLFVHVLSSLQYIMDSPGPERVYTTGDKDGIGDTPHIMLSYFDYPAHNEKKPFKAALTANYSDGVSRRWGSTNFLIIGDEGTMRVEWDRVTLNTLRPASATDFSGLPNIGNGIDKPQQINEREWVFVEDNYHNCHYDHFVNFFDGIRKKTKVDGDVLFSVQTAVPAVLCLDSFHQGKPALWDPVNLILK